MPPRNGPDHDETPTPRWRGIDIRHLPTEDALAVVHSALVELDDGVRTAREVGAATAARVGSLRDGVDRWQRQEAKHHGEVIAALAQLEKKWAGRVEYLERRMDRVAEHAAEAKGAAERSGSHPQIVVLDKHKAGESDAPPNPIRDWMKRNKRAAAAIGVLLTVAGVLAELIRQLPP